MINFKGFKISGPFQILNMNNNDASYLNITESQTISSMSFITVFNENNEVINMNNNNLNFLLNCKFIIPFIHIYNLDNNVLNNNITLNNNNITFTQVDPYNTNTIMIRNFIIRDFKISTLSARISEREYIDQ